jgi:hypothetical protein
MSDVVIVVLIACFVVVLVAAVLFAVFGRRPHSDDGELSPFESLKHFHLAVAGALLRGSRKDVGANEFIATLMVLAQRDTLCVEYDQEGKGLALRICDKQTGERRATSEALPRLPSEALPCLPSEAPPCLPIDDKALELLRDAFADEDGAVYLSSAKQRGERNSAQRDRAYREWKQLVRAVADKSVGAGRTPALIQRSLLYAGYALILCCALVSYLFTLEASAILLVTGGIVIALSLVMQHNIFVEKQRIRRLYQWLDTLETHREEIPTDRASVQGLLAYACLFGIGTKTGEALQDLVASPIVDEEVAHLEFWKDLKAQLYADS